MRTSITITVSDEIYHQLEQVARPMNRDVAEIVADTVSQAFLESPDGEGETIPRARTNAERTQKLRGLLDRKKEGNLTEIEQMELNILTGMYRTGILEKDPALDKMILDKKRSLPRSIGMGASNIPNLASRCEELLWNEEF